MSRPPTPPSRALAMTDSPVSWQSAFWGIFAFATNTAFQDCGSVLGMDPQYRAFLKFSPAVCLFDSVDICVQTGLHLRGHGLRAAIREVAMQRRERETEAEVRSFSDKAIHWITFILAVLQAIKLFACRGLLWTQVLAAVYLFGYLVQGTLNQLGHSGNHDARPQSPGSRTAQRRSRLTFTWLAAGAQLLLWPCALFLPALDPTDQRAGVIHTLYIRLLRSFFWQPSYRYPRIRIAYLKGEVVFAILALLAGALMVDVAWAPVTVSDTRYPSGIALAFTVCAVSILLCGFPPDFKNRAGSSRAAQREFESWAWEIALWDGMDMVGPRSVTAVAVTLFAMSAFYMVLVAALKVRGGRLFKVNGRQGFVFMIMTGMNLFCGYVAYAVVYDTRGTYQPPWTENLG